MKSKLELGVETTENTLGVKLKNLRQKKKLSIRALADRSGLTHPFISKVEKNETSPSISSLKKILAALDTTLSEFFSENVSFQPVTFYKACELVELADGKLLSYRQVGAGLKGAQMMLLHERYAPGAGTGDDMYSHQAQEGGIIVKGKLLLTVGDESKTLEEGDAYYFDSSIPHKMENIYGEECVVISSIAPPTF